MTVSPVIEWRAVASPNGTVSSLTFLGNGFNGAIPAGTSSSQVTIRLYNNFANAASVADALNCVLAIYDDTVHQGLAQNGPTTSQYVQVQCVDYNGNTGGADTQFFAIGSSVKHSIPMNSGTISGSTPNYVTIILQIVVPSTATQGSVSQGLWIEYSSTV